jgi:SAM-dependent MidA family methyltransferase
VSQVSRLGKKELNERFYGAVDPEAAFVTEVQVGFHQVAAARLVARHAAELGKRRIRVLELGASACLFAIAFLDVLSRLALMGDASLDAVDYTAVELSRGALGAALRSAVQVGFDECPPAAGGTGAIAALARLRRPGAVEASLELVESDANRFVDETDDGYDVVVLNELLDDLPCRLFYADARGETHELAPYAHPRGPGWHVQLAESDAGAEELPPGTLRSTSEESLRLLRGIVDRLGRGGMVLVHDYGFNERFAGTAQYAEPQLALPPFVEVEYPETAGVPKSFFRVYGNEAAQAVQITNDVNFAELTELLEPSGTVITLPHGNLLTSVRQFPDLFFKGDGVFLSEFMNLTAEDDLAALLADLHERQAELRDRYVTTLGGGRTAIFSDLIYVKA